MASDPAFADRLRLFGKEVLATLGPAYNPVAAARKSEGWRRFWASPENKHRQLSAQAKGRRRGPNYVEEALLGLLENEFPCEWRYVGDGAVILGGLKPDFINVNGKKLIIELFGETWHTPNDEARRQEVFARFGYSLLVIWARELQNREAVIAKVREFVEGSHHVLS